MISAAKSIKCIALVTLILFMLASAADAFTVVRPEEKGAKPMTRSQKRALRRAQQNQEDSGVEEPKPEESQAPVFIHDGIDNGGASGAGAAGSFTPSPTPTVEPSPTPSVQTLEEKQEARKKRDLVLLIVMLFLIEGIAFWYFTRNVNFKKIGGR